MAGRHVRIVRQEDPPLLAPNVDLNLANIVRATRRSILRDDHQACRGEAQAGPPGLCRGLRERRVSEGIRGRSGRGSGRERAHDARRWPRWGGCRRVERRATELTELHRRAVHAATPRTHALRARRRRRRHGRRLRRFGARWTARHVRRERRAAARAEPIRRGVRRAAATAGVARHAHVRRLRRKIEVGGRGSNTAGRALGEPRTAVAAEDEVCWVFSAAPIAPHVPRGTRGPKRVKRVFCKHRGRTPFDRSYQRESGSRTSNTSSPPIMCATPNPNASFARNSPALSRQR